jgi:putative endonuclease
VWYVYFLALSNSDIYVGSTNDLKRRFRSHELGKVASTQAFLPIKLRCYIGVETAHNARKLERYFKSGSGKAFAKKRLLDGSTIQILSTITSFSSRLAARLGIGATSSSQCRPE